MAALPTIKRFDLSDYPTQASWISNLLYPLNLLLTTIYAALNNGITFGQNMLGQINTLSVKASAPTTTFLYKFSGQGAPQAVFVGNVQGGTPSGAVTCTWSYNSGTITITNVTGLGTSGTYNITFVVIGG
jgi:hypothetical protein